MSLLHRTASVLAAALLALGLVAITAVPADESGSARPFLWKSWLLLDEGIETNPALAFSPDGKILAASDGGGIVKVWHVDNGDDAPVFAGSPVGTPLALAFSTDGARLLLAGHDAVTGWETAGRREQSSFRWPPGSADAAAFTPDGRGVAYGGADGAVRVFGLDGTLLIECGEHAEAVLALAFRPDGRLLASGGADGTIRLWELPSGEERGVLRARDRALVRGLAFSADGALLASVGGRDGVTLWDIATETVRARWGARPQPYRSVAFAPDGATLAAGSSHGAIDLWDSTDPERHVVCRAHAGLARDLKFADPVTLASAGSDGTVRLWEGGRRALPGKSLAPDELRELVQDLQRVNEAKTARAILRLAAAAQDALPYLRQELRSGKPPPPEVIAQHLAALESDQYPIRVAAGKALEQLGPVARPLLTKALSTPLTLETRRRLERILALDDETQRENRQRLGLGTVLVLERNASADAVRLLQELAVGLPDPAVCREAQTALTRLGAPLPAGSPRLP
jgi:hypothetical protein